VKFTRLTPAATEQLHPTVTIVDTALPVITCTTNAVSSVTVRATARRIAAWLASVSATDVCSGTAVVTNDYKG